MDFNSSPIELTTSATDALLAIESIGLIVWLARGSAAARSRVLLWCCVFGLVAFSSSLGAVAHGVEMQDTTRAALWKLIYLSLGIVVAVFMAGAVHDWLGEPSAAWLLPWAVTAGCGFFAVTEFYRLGFVLFVVYEAAFMLSALTIYWVLAVGRRLKGAGTITAAVALNLAAAGAQGSQVSARLVIPFDHNGIFHIIQIAALATLAVGLKSGMRVRTTAETI